MALSLAVLAALGGTGCTPNVGDSCQLSTDCGSTGNLVCDTSEFDGYCTMVDCVEGSCLQNNAVCVLFDPSVPGCSYNDRQAGSRISQSFCMKTCESNSDCRDGYVCAAPSAAPWFGDNLDNAQYKLVCLPLPPNGNVGGDSGPFVEPEAAVCQVSGTTWDAFPPPPEADAQADASHE